jgi:hypothetical protein
VVVLGEERGADRGGGPRSSQSEGEIADERGPRTAQLRGLFRCVRCQLFTDPREHRAHGHGLSVGKLHLQAPLERGTEAPEVEATAWGRNHAALGIVEIELLVASVRLQVGLAQIEPGVLPYEQGKIGLLADEVPIEEVL